MLFRSCRCSVFSHLDPGPDASMIPFWSQIARELSPYVPGEQPRIANLVKLNTNESPFGPSPLALEAMRAAAADSSARTSGDFTRCYGWRSKRCTPVRSIDHGRAERHQPCRVGRSSARRSSAPTRRP